MNTRTLRWLASFGHRAAHAADGAPTLTIVRHHRVLEDGERPLYRLGVPAGVLREQLRMLADRGWGPVTVAAGLEHLASGRGHRVALTFDDGYRDNVTHALPLLAEVGGHATFYLTAGLIEERRAPWWDELSHLLTHARTARLAADGNGTPALELAGEEGRRRALDALLPGFRIPPPARTARLDRLRAQLGVADAARCELATWDESRRLIEADMEVGAHTLTHPHLTTLDPDGQAREIAGSADLIATRLGVRPRGLAYPGGDHDARTIAAAAAAGLDYAVTTRAGLNRPDTPRHALLRRGFSEGTCIGPLGFSRRLALAELDGAFDGLRERRRAS